MLFCSVLAPDSLTLFLDSPKSAAAAAMTGQLYSIPLVAQSATVLTAQTHFFSPSPANCAFPGRSILHSLYVVVFVVVMLTAVTSQCALIPPSFSLKQYRNGANRQADICVHSQ